MPEAVDDPGYPEAQPADFRQREYGYDTYRSWAGRDRQQEQGKGVPQRVVYDTSWNTVSQTTNNDDWQGYRNPPDWWTDDRRNEWQDRQFTRNDNRWNDWQETSTQYDYSHQEWVQRPQQRSNWDQNQSRRNNDYRRSDRSY